MDLYLDQQLEVMQSGLPLMDLDHKLPLVALRGSATDALAASDSAIGAASSPSP
jgi:hypothetical protein